MNIFKATVLFMLITISMNGQTSSLTKMEDSIQELFAKIILAKNDIEKLNYNSKLEEIFAELLNKNSSFDYPLNKLKHVSKLSSDDGLLRVITWNIPYTNGIYKYFGFVQLKSKNNSSKVFKLNDHSAKITEAQTKILDYTNWYGALYYKILSNTYKNKTYYTLLGWDGNDNFTNKKIIDILIIKRKKIQFGAPIIKEGDITYTRSIFEYAKQAKMMLRYDEKQKMIVFDHLAPSLKKFKGQYLYYGPDLSQDGLEFIEGFWVLQANLDLRNEKSNTNKKPIKTSN